jgi:hypothetical protein
MPVRGAPARWLDRVLSWFTRRPRRRADAPDRYGQGVDPSLPPIKPLGPRDRELLDFERISRGSR